MYYPSYYYFDPSYLLLILGMVVSMIAQARVRSVTGRYAQVAARCGLTGADLARRMLDEGGLSDVAIEVIQGNLTDHYDPAVRLIPVPGKGVGEWVEFGGLLGRAPIIPVHPESASAFIERGGRIPAPINSLKN